MSRTKRPEPNKLLEKIFSSLYGLVAYLDRDFNFIRVNQAYAAADGREPEFFIGKNHFALYPHAENEAIFRQVVQSGEPYIAYAKPFEYPDAPERGVSYWDWVLTPVHDDSGEIDGLLLSLSDVTARVLAEEERRKSDERFRLLFDNAADAIFIHDLQGHFLEVNEIACQRLGYRRDELLGMGVEDIDAPKMAEQFTAKARQLEEEGRLLIETHHVTHSGEVIPVEVSARMISYQGQSAVLSIARDISQRVRTEQALRDSEANLRALTNAITESAFLLDRQYRVKVINDTGAQRFGKTADAIIGKSILELIPEPLSSSRKQVMDSVLETHQPHAVLDVRGGLHLSSSLYPVLTEEGTADGIAVFSKDITREERMRDTELLLREIDSHVLHADSIEQMMDAVCQDLVERLEYSLAWIGRKETGGGVAIISLYGEAHGYADALREIGVRWDDTPEGKGPTGMAIRTGEVQHCKLSSQHFKPWREAAKQYGLASVFAIPLIIKGEVFGALTLYSSHETTFDDPAEVARINSIANRLRIASDASNDQQRLRLLGAALSSAGNGVLITKQEGGIVWVNDAFCRQSGYSRSEVLGKTPRILNSGRQSGAFYAELWDTILAGRRWTGETVEQRKNGEHYTVSQTITPIFNDSGEITHFIAIHEDITAQKQAQERVEYLAHYDALTSLANRALFYERLKHMRLLCKRSEEYFALIFLDLDRFKPINDTYGHAVGDRLLQEVAKRITFVLRESDTAARLGGDEFTVILPGVGNENDAFRVGNKIAESIAAPYQLEGHEIHTSASIGVAIYPDHGLSDEALITAADTAMYMAKQAGRNCIALAESNTE